MRLADGVPLAGGNDDDTRGDTNTNLQSSCLWEMQPPHRFYDIERGPNGALGLGFMRERKSEKGAQHRHLTFGTHNLHTD